MALMNNRQVFILFRKDIDNFLHFNDTDSVTRMSLYFIPFFFWNPMMVHTDNFRSMYHFVLHSTEKVSKPMPKIV